MVLVKALVLVLVMALVKVLALVLVLALEGRADLVQRKPDANWGSSAQAQVFVNALRGVQVSIRICLDLWRRFV